MKTATLTEQGKNHDMTTEVISGDNNQIFLPPEYVEALGIKPGDKVEIRLEDGKIQVKKHLSIREIVKKYGRPGKAPTLEELRRERGLEDW